MIMNCLIIAGQSTKNHTWSDNITNFLTNEFDNKAEIAVHQYDFWLNGVTANSDEAQTQLEVNIAKQQYRNMKIDYLFAKSLGCIISLELLEEVSPKELHLYGPPTSFDLPSLMKYVFKRQIPTFIYVNEHDPVSSLEDLRRLLQNHPFIMLSVLKNRNGHQYDTVEIAHLQ